MTKEENKQSVNRSVLNKVVKTLQRGGLTLLFVGVGLATAQAQQKSLTLPEAVKLGLDNSKKLKLSQSKINQAVSQYNEAKDAALPTGKASLAYNRAEIPANVLSLGGLTLGLPSSADAWVGTAGLNETIFAGGRLKMAQQSANLLVDVARLDADKDRDQIVLDVISAYFNLYKVEQSQKVLAKNIDAANDQLKQASRFYEQGLVTKNDVLRFQLLKSNYEVSAIDLESNRKIINFSLNVLLGLPDETEIATDESAVHTPQLTGLSTYLDSALSNRQELKQLDLQNRVAALNLKSIRAAQLPNVGAGLSAYYIDATANPLPQSNQYLAPITLAASVSWNFSSLWTTKNKLATAKIEQEEIGINKGLTTDYLKTEVNRGYQSYSAALHKIELLQTAIDQANENNKILESKYQRNVASATDRVDAQTLLYQAQINLELAKADAGLAYYNLLKSTGKLNK